MTYGVQQNIQLKYGVLKQPLHKATEFLIIEVTHERILVAGFAIVFAHHNIAHVCVLITGH